MDKRCKKHGQYVHHAVPHYQPGKIQGFSQRYGFKSKPVYPACFLLVDDMDCPNVGGNGGNQDGDVDDGEGERKAVVHRGCFPGVQAEVKVPPQRHQPCFYLHVFYQIEVGRGERARVINGVDQNLI